MDGVDGRRGLGGLPELVRNLLQPALEVEGPAALHEVLDVVQNLMTHHMPAPDWPQHRIASTNQHAISMGHEREPAHGACEWGVGQMREKWLENDVEVAVPESRC